MLTSIRRAFVVIAAFLLLGGGVWLGWTISHRDQVHTEAVTSQSVVLSLQKQGFLVTQGYISNERVTIDRSTGSALKDFFFGQTIEAVGKVRVSSGVDLKKVTSTDVFIDSTTVTITLPPVEIYTAEVVDDIMLVNKEGVVKRFIDHDDGYNAAANELRLSAMKTASSEEIQTEAEIMSIDLIKTLLSGIAPNRTIIVQFRS